MRKILPFMLLLSVACTRPAGARHDLLAIVPSAPRMDYSESNLLIDSMGRFYYFQQPYKVRGFLSDDEDHGKPVFINLRPSAIIQVPQQGLLDFLKLNIIHRDIGGQYGGQHHTLLAIGLEKDSMRNPVFPELKAFFSESHMWLGIRRFTEEETVVMTYKRSDLSYDPSRIRWDSSKIYFFVTVPDEKFVPPKAGY